MTKMAWIAVVGYILSTAVSLGVGIAVLYVALHFIQKAW